MQWLFRSSTDEATCKQEHDEHLYSSSQYAHMHTRQSPSMVCSTGMSLLWPTWTRNTHASVDVCLLNAAERNMCVAQHRQNKYAPSHRLHSDLGFSAAGQSVEERPLDIEHHRDALLQQQLLSISGHTLLHQQHVRLVVCHTLHCDPQVLMLLNTPRPDLQHNPDMAKVGTYLLSNICK